MEKMGELDMGELLDFYTGKNVLVTGHTGFKGSWLCKILALSGANVTGYSLLAPTNPNLHELSGVGSHINSIIGDIRDRDRLMHVFDEEQPEIVFHLAAQPIVRESYRDPAYTYETNVMGTVNICEAIRQHSCVRSFLNGFPDSPSLSSDPGESSQRRCAVSELHELLPAHPDVQLLLHLLR